MSSEGAFSRTAMKALRLLAPVRIETLTRPGVPDIFTVAGPVELKVLPTWPKRPRTPLRVRHFTADQRDFLRSWEKAGGRSWVLMKVENDVLLLDGSWAACNLGTTTRAELEAAAAWSGKRMNPAEMAGIMLRNAVELTPFSKGAHDRLVR